MPASIARAQLKLQLDVSMGDPITPEPQLIAYQQLLDAGTFTILGYPLATVIAEKLSTAIELGDLNTRDRDYGDLYRLLRANALRVPFDRSARDAPLYAPQSAREDGCR